MLVMGICLLAFAANAPAQKKHDNEMKERMKSHSAWMGKSEKMMNVDEWVSSLKKKLSLDADQTAKVRDILSTAHTDVMETHRKIEEEKMNQLHKEVSDRADKASNDIKGVLKTDDQKTKFAQIQEDIKKHIDNHFAQAGSEKDSKSGTRTHSGKSKSGK